MAPSRKRKASTQSKSTQTKRITRSQKPTPKSFFDLPPEIRNAIYDLALPEAAPIEVKKQYGGSPLTFANKTIRSECLSIYLLSNTFNIDNIDIQIWASAVGANNLFAHMSRIFFQVSAWFEWPLCGGASFCGGLNIHLSLEPHGSTHRIILEYKLAGPHVTDDDYERLELSHRSMVPGQSWHQGARWAQLRRVIESVSKSSSDMTFADLIKLRSKMTTSGQYFFTYVVRETDYEDEARESWKPIIIEPTGGLRPRRDLNNLCTGVFETNDGERRVSGSICHDVLFRSNPDHNEDGPWSKCSRKEKPKKSRRSLS